MKQKLGLSYRNFNSANIRYNDERFDETRLWTSRLLAQILKDDVLLIAIDESSFNHTQAQKLRWQPKVGALGTVNEKSG